MLTLNKKVTGAAEANATLELNFEQRSRSRLRATLVDGRDAAIMPERGSQLLPGDILESDCGELIAVVAADETVSEIRSDNAHNLARACYHLGNRHVALQIDAASLRYLHDHVLDDMVKRLGLEVEVKNAPFDPEPGAYGDHAHIQGHSH